MHERRCDLLIRVNSCHRGARGELALRGTRDVEREETEEGHREEGCESPGP